MVRFVVTCPHCQAMLELDDDSQVVVNHKPPEKPKNTTTLDDRLKALAQEKHDARSKLDEAMRSEKAGAAIREEKFRKLLEVAKDEPIEKPIREIDLD